MPSQSDHARVSLALSYDRLIEAAVLLDVDAYAQIHAAIYDLADRFRQEVAELEGWKIGPVCESGHGPALMESEGVQGPVEVFWCQACGRREEWG